MNGAGYREFKRVNRAMQIYPFVLLRYQFLAMLRFPFDGNDIQNEIGVAFRCSCQFRCSGYTNPVFFLWELSCIFQQKTAPAIVVAATRAVTINNRNLQAARHGS